MKRRDFTIGLLIAAAAPSASALEGAKQHRIAIVMAGGTIARISEMASDPVARRFYQAFFQELRRLGDVEGQNLTIERYSGEGRPAGHADLAREVVRRNPEGHRCLHRPGRPGGARSDRHNPDRFRGG